MTSSTDRDAAASAHAEYRSLGGVPESEEPAPLTPTATATATATATPASMLPVSTATATAPSMSRTPAPAADRRHAAHSLAGQRTLGTSASPSTTTSPRSSRDASPAHHTRTAAPPPPPPGAAKARSGLRSRKSSTDVSPSRPSTMLAGSTSTSTAASTSNSTSHAPSASAIQRALSSANIPQLSPASSTDTVVKVPRSSSARPPPVANSGDSTPRWPISPRLKSPEPSSESSRTHSRRNSLRVATAAAAKKPEAASTPAIVVQGSSPASMSRVAALRDEAVASDPEDPPLSIKGSSRGVSGVIPKLETVQESSLPTTPGFDGLEEESFTHPASSSHRAPDQERNDVSSSKVTEDVSNHNNRNSVTSFTSTTGNNTSTYSTTGSGSDSGSRRTIKRGKMQEQRASSVYRSNAISSQPSLSSLSIRSQRDPPLRNVTVETETVSSIAQAPIGNQDRSASGRVDGSLRLKPSSETIRPKKEKKPNKRKAPSINTGTGRSSHISYHYNTSSRPGMGSRSNTASSIGSPVSYRSYDDRRSMVSMSPPPSPEMRMLPNRPISLRYFYPSTNSSSRKASSKADVFEQKVASAVDEANSSDSDATFIYESNPPEQQPHRSRHHHSRTPSMTSIASLADPRQLAIREAHKNPGKKSSMKFVNAFSNADPDALDRGEGTIRIGSGRVGQGSHHHHIGRHGQGRGPLGHLVMDSDSSMAQSSRVRGSSARHPSQPNSPRFHPSNVGNGQANGTKKPGEYSTYDLDAEHAADDERTPLIPSGRSPRVRTPRRRNSATLRQLEQRHRHRHDGGWCRKFAGCLVLSILLLVVVFCSVGLVVAATKPLIGIKIETIQNVVASQEEIMLDLVVGAVNPNIIGVTIAEMDVTIFAKSKHIGSDTWWRLHGNGPQDNVDDWLPVEAQVSPLEVDVSSNDGVDEGTDPINDPEQGEARTMSLGRVSHFDSALNFESSFWYRKRAESIGEIRLSHPGSKSEAGGVARWEEVLQHPFELIVRGVLKYQLPLSTHVQTASVTRSYFYDPDLERKKLIKNKMELTEENHHVLPKPPGRYNRRAHFLLKSR